MPHRRNTNSINTNTTLYGSKEVKRLLRNLFLSNTNVTITRTGGGHVRVKAEGLPPIIVSSGKGDPHSHKNAAKELRRAGYKV